MFFLVLKEDCGMHVKIASEDWTLANEGLLEGLLRVQD